MTTADVARGARGPYRHLWIALALLVPATFLAFAKSYSKLLTFSGQPMSATVHVHGALMGLWILMLVGQAWFIRARRYAAHRWVGRSSFLIAPLTLIMTVVTVHETLNLKAPNITLLDSRLEIYDLMQVIGFGLSWALAMVYRKRVRLHVRFMVSTAFAFGNAILFRVLLNWFFWVPGMNIAEDLGNIDNVAAVNGALLVAALLGLIAMDWRLGIRRSPFWLVTGTTVIIHVGFFTFTKTEGWSSIVRWFASI
jgi:hypothetical protein